MGRHVSEFQWLPSDSIIAHAWGILIDPAELARLVACVCQFPNIDATDHCINCKRKFVFDPHRLPLPPSTETE